MRDLTRVALIGLVIGVVLTACLVTRPVPGAETPWEFIRDALPHIDSVGKAAALVFFGTVVTFMNFLALTAKLRLSLPLFLIPLMALALFSPAVRQSRLVRTGFVLAGVGVVPLLIAGRFNNNPLGFGFLFAFLTPVAGLMIVAGIIMALTAGRAPDDGQSLSETDAPHEPMEG